MTTSTEQGTPITGVPCLVSDCTKTVHSRGYCQQHYRRWWKYGDPEHPIQPTGRKRSPDSTDHRKLDPEEKARRKALRAVPKTHCIHGHELTDANTYVTGRGQPTCRICTRNSQQRYHGRAVSGDTPVGLRNGDKTHCPQGHEYTPENIEWFRNQRRCRACRLAQFRQYQYGLSRDEFARMLAEQGGCCAICAVELPENRKIHTDHCHTTGVVRGLLCSGCNLMLGHAKDQPDRLRAGAEYLARFREDSPTAETAAWITTIHEGEEHRAK